MERHPQHPLVAAQLLLCDVVDIAALILMRVCEVGCHWVMACVFFSETRGMVEQRELLSSSTVFVPEREKTQSVPILLLAELQRTTSQYHRSPVIIIHAALHSACNLANLTRQADKE